MSLKKLMTNYASYNVWANQQHINWLSTKTDEQLQHEIPSSYPSIIKTLNHIWGVEEYWFSIITKTQDFTQRFGIEELHRDEVFKGMMNRSELILNKVLSFSEEDLNEEIKVVSPWFKSNQCRYEYIQHVINHGTYHRGQIVTIGRNIGITDAPMTDYNAFNVMKESKTM